MCQGRFLSWVVEGNGGFDLVHDDDDDDDDVSLCEKECVLIICRGRVWEKLREERKRERGASEFQERDHDFWDCLINSWLGFASIGYLLLLLLFSPWRGSLWYVNWYSYLVFGFGFYLPSYLMFVFYYRFWVSHGTWILMDWRSTWSDLVNWRIALSWRFFTHLNLHITAFLQRFIMLVENGISWNKKLLPLIAYVCSLCCTFCFICFPRVLIPFPGFSPLMEGSPLI